MLLAEEIAYRVLPRVRPGRALADYEWRVLAAVAEAIHEGSPVDIDPAQIANNVETFLAIGASRRAWRVRVLLVLIDVVARVQCGAGMAELSRDQLIQLVNDRFASEGRIWRLCAKIRYLVLLGVYGDNCAVAATGYVPVETRERFTTKLAQVRRRSHFTVVSAAPHEITHA